jgi:hypothetical protein
MLAVLQVLGMKSSQLSCSQTTEESKQWPAMVLEKLGAMDMADVTKLATVMDLKTASKLGKEETRAFRRRGQPGAAHLLSLANLSCLETCEKGHWHYGECLSRALLRHVGH